MLCTLANLDEANIGALSSLEGATGKTVLAFSCQDFGPAAPSADELAQLQKLEAKLGVSLVAVEA